MIVVTDDSLEFLKKYINTPSPSGNEWEGQKIWTNYIKNYVDEYSIDNYGTSVGVINPDAKYKVMIEAHCDVVSWYVNYITTNGLIYVKKNGSTDHQIATSKWVNIHTSSGIVEGAFGWPAIHIRKKDKNPLPNNIFIDVGATSKTQVERMGIGVGDYITYQDEFKVLNNNRFVGPGLDNKIGGFMIAQVARLLKEENINLPFGLYITNAVQEEVGKAGMDIISNKINPDVGIVTDVTHDTTTPGVDIPSRGYLKLGDGPVLSIAPPVQRGLFNLIEKTAKDNNIKYQKKVANKITGTDTDILYRTGASSALISIPMKYMHTTVELVSKNDVIRATKLIYNTLLNIEDKHDFRFFK